MELCEEGKNLFVQIKLEKVSDNICLIERYLLEHDFQNLSEEAKKEMLGA